MTLLIDPAIRLKFTRRLRQRELRDFVESARAALRLKGEVAVLVTTDEAVRELNLRFRRKNKPTDVLSFPAGEVRGGDFAGDLAISAETAARQAEELGHSLAEELKILVLHGILHLAGYDHEVDQGKMARRELLLRRKLGLSTGLIERANGPACAGRRR